MLAAPGAQVIWRSCMSGNPSMRSQRMKTLTPYLPARAATAAAPVSATQKSRTQPVDRIPVRRILILEKIAHQLQAEVLTDSPANRP